MQMDLKNLFVDPSHLALSHSMTQKLRNNSRCANDEGDDDVNAIAPGGILARHALQVHYIPCGDRIPPYYSPLSTQSLIQGHIERYVRLSTNCIDISHLS